MPDKFPRPYRKNYEGKSDQDVLNMALGGDGLAFAELGFRKNDLGRGHSWDAAEYFDMGIRLANEPECYYGRVVGCRWDSGAGVDDIKKKRYLQIAIKNGIKDAAAFYIELFEPQKISEEELIEALDLACSAEAGKDELEYDTYLLTALCLRAYSRYYENSPVSHLYETDKQAAFKDIEKALKIKEYSAYWYADWLAKLGVTAKEADSFVVEITTVFGSNNIPFEIDHPFIKELCSYARGHYENEIRGVTYFDNESPDFKWFVSRDIKDADEGRNNEYSYGAVYLENNKRNGWGKIVNVTRDYSEWTDHEGDTWGGYNTNINVYIGTFLNDKKNGLFKHNNEIELYRDDNLITLNNFINEAEEIPQDKIDLYGLKGKIYRGKNDVFKNVFVFIGDNGEKIYTHSGTGLVFVQKGNDLPEKIYMKIRGQDVDTELFRFFLNGEMPKKYDHLYHFNLEKI